MPRIAFVGAGSVVFTKHLLADVLSFEELRDAEIALHDVDLDRLATAEAMARYVAAARGAAPRITTHLDRRSALDGADYVLNMVQVGGHAATLVDFDLPARYGLRQTIADTLGIGGIFRALRTADHMLALGTELADLAAPGAWLLNYTNPMAMLCWLVYAGTPTDRVVGLCHSVEFTKETLCAIVGVPQDEVEILSAGVNHQALFLRFERDGESLYPALDAAIARDPDLRRRFRVAVYERFGVFPTESSEHLAEYVPSIMRHDFELERFRTPFGDYIRRSEAIFRSTRAWRAALAAGRTRSTCRSRTSTPPGSSIRSRPASSAPCTGTSATPASSPACPRMPASRCHAASTEVGSTPSQSRRTRWSARP